MSSGKEFLHEAIIPSCAFPHSFLININQQNNQKGEFSSNEKAEKLLEKGNCCGDIHSDSPICFATDTSECCKFRHACIERIYVRHHLAFLVEQ